MPKYKSIGIDLHGVMDAKIEVFKYVTNILMAKGTKIYVVSGPDLRSIQNELRGYGFKQDIHYAGVYSIVDYLKGKGVNMWQSKDKTWWASDRDWWSAKAEICKEIPVEAMVDDNAGYAGYFRGSGIKFYLYNPGRNRLLEEIGL